LEGALATSRLDSWSVALIRQTKGISLEQIADLTKLRVSILKAIEDGDFDALPGGIYNISYIRQYARAIDADESRLLQLYRLQHQVAS
jgi:cytoskeleton protein RodZ